MEMFRGTGVALVTPFQNDKIDFPALGNIIEHVISGGVDYIVSLGSTGEAINLSRAECKEVLTFTYQKVAGRKPLVAGLFGGNNTAQLIERIEAYGPELEGYDAIMSSNPSYVKPTQEGIYQHYLQVADASPLPIIIYNVPGRTCGNITAETCVRLANASPKFIAVKEASGDLEQIQKILKDRPEGFLVLSGDDPTTLATIGCGGDGVISVIANTLPGPFSDMVRAALDGAYPTAQQLNLSMFDLHPLLYVDGNPAGVKACLHILGLCENELRLPLTPVTEATFAKLKKELGKVVGVPV